MSNASMVAFGLMLVGGANAGVSCHIHPPGSTPDRPVGIIGPYATPEICERERALRFGDAGRCHCAADFTPRWVPSSPAPMPGDSPLG